MGKMIKYYSPVDVEYLVLIHEEGNVWVKTVIGDKISIRILPITSQFVVCPVFWHIYL